MNDQGVRAALRDFAPDPMLDTKGFLRVAAIQALREMEDAQGRMTPRQFQEWMLLRSLERLALGIIHKHPRAVQELQARAVVRNLAAWSALNESTDTR